jgi:predicted peptidase
MRLCLLSLLTLAATLAAAADLNPLDVSEARDFKAADGTKLLYRLFRPAAVDPAQAYPLVLFLHGAGGRGADNKGQIRDQPVALHDLVNEPNRSAHPCYIVAPQCPAEHERRWVDVPWNQGSYSQDKVKITPQLQAVLEMLDSVRGEFKIDPQRLYVTGISMGGYGTWDLLERRPELFAAAIPICGGGDPSRAASISQLPIQAFHGGADPVVPTRGTREMIAALKAAGGSPQYTEFPGVGHDSWHKAYATPGLWDWLFGCRRP